MSQFQAQYVHVDHVPSYFIV